MNVAWSCGQPSLSNEFSEAIKVDANPTGSAYNESLRFDWPSDGVVPRHGGSFWPWLLGVTLLQPICSAYGEDPRPSGLSRSTENVAMRVLSYRECTGAISDVVVRRGSEKSTYSAEVRAVASNLEDSFWPSTNYRRPGYNRKYLCWTRKREWPRRGWMYCWKKLVSSRAT